LPVGIAHSPFCCYEHGKQDPPSEHQPSGKDCRAGSLPGQNPQLDSKRMLVELIGDAIEAQKPKQTEVSNKPGNSVTPLTGGH